MSTVFPISAQVLALYLLTPGDYEQSSCSRCGHHALRDALDLVWPHLYCLNCGNTRLIPRHRGYHVHLSVTATSFPGPMVTLRVPRALSRAVERLEQALENGDGVAITETAAAVFNGMRKTRKSCVRLYMVCSLLLGDAYSLTLRDVLDWTNEQRRAACFWVNQVLSGDPDAELPPMMRKLYYGH